MRKILSIILAIMMFLSLISCAKDGGDALTWQEQYDLGLRYLENGSYEEAILAFRAAIKIDPKQPGAYTALVDAYLATGNYDDAAESARRGREVCGDQEAFDRVDAILDFMTSYEMGIRITDFRFDKEKFLAGEETSFLVTVAYRCPVDVPCTVMIGANTDEPTGYLMKDEDYKVENEGIYTFRTAFVPTSWPDAPFTVYTNLSRADHGESWTPLASSTMTIDAQGRTAAGDSSFYPGDVSNMGGTGDVTLPALSEITFMGQPIPGLTTDTIKRLVTQAGMELSTNDDWGDQDHWWLSARTGDWDGAEITALQYYEEATVSLVSYTHYLSNLGGPTMDVGLRGIRTHDSMDTVLTKLGLEQMIPAAEEVANLIAVTPYNEVTELLWNGNYHYFDPVQMAEFAFGGSMGAREDENGVLWTDNWGFSLYYDVDSVSYSMDFTFQEDVLTDVYIHIYAH